MLLLLTLAALCAVATHAQRQRITNLPGLDQMPSFAMWSGYLSVAPTRNNFFWHVEAANSPATAPLVVWYTGGPGCSG